MSIRGTVIMLLLCLGLGAFWYLHDYKGEAERQEAKTQEERIFPELKAEEIVGLRWKSTGGDSVPERVLKLEKGLWMLYSDANSKCIASVRDTESTVKQIAELARLSVISEDPQESEYASYGLDKAPYELEISAGEPDGKDAKKYVLLIGADTPAGDAYYMRVKDQKAVLEVAAPFMDFFRNRDIDVREKSGLIVSPERVVKLVLHQEGREDICLTKEKSEKLGDSEEPTTAQAKWTITKPLNARADLSVVNDYLWQVHSVETVQFIPPMSIDSMGPLSVTWDITTDADRTITVELWGDADIGGKGKFYLRRVDTEEFMIVLYDHDRSALFPKQADDFLDHRILSCSTDDMRRLEVTVPARNADGKQEPELRLDVRRIRDGWEVRQPEKSLRDENKRDAAIFELAYALTDMKWAKKLPAAKSGAQPNNGCAVAVIYGEKDQVLARVSADPKKMDSGYIVTVEGDASQYVLDKDPSADWAGSIRTVADMDKTASDGD
ncbi:DUF4340 domain-containing protein, partial [bacterium]|nr:DUF4340 domain-containing protein [bacterium]